MFSSGYTSAGETSFSHSYSIKKSEVVVPPDVPMGQYRRITQPFDNWLLTCDENMKVGKKICNVSQTVIDETGELAFNWAMAATEKGTPFFILRTSANIKTGSVITMTVIDPNGDKNKPLPPLQVALQGCTPAMCFGQIEVNRFLKSAIGIGASVSVSYTLNNGQTITLILPLRGLKEAVASIK